MEQVEEALRTARALLPPDAAPSPADDLPTLVFNKVFGMPEDRVKALLELSTRLRTEIDAAAAGPKSPVSIYRQRPGR